MLIPVSGFGGVLPNHGLLSMSQHWMYSTASRSHGMACVQASAISFPTGHTSHAQHLDSPSPATRAAEGCRSPCLLGEWHARCHSSCVHVKWRAGVWACAAVRLDKSLDAHPKRGHITCPNPTATLSNTVKYRNNKCGRRGWLMRGWACARKGPSDHLLVNSLPGNS